MDVGLLDAVLGQHGLGSEQDVSRIAVERDLDLESTGELPAAQGPEMRRLDRKNAGYGLNLDGICTGLYQAKWQ